MEVPLLMNSCYCSLILIGITFLVIPSILARPTAILTFGIISLAGIFANDRTCQIKFDR